MSLFYIFLAAIVQGITEFLPVSSSGHLILLPKLTGSADQGTTIDVAVHLGSLGAVILYFWTDVKLCLQGVPRLLRGKIDTQGSKLAFLLIIATIPVILFGLVLQATGLTAHLRSIEVIGWMMLVFGIILYWFDQKAPQVKTQKDLNLKVAIILGFWQAIALIPGTSRSGSTITGARALGFTRKAGAKFSMLMSIPTIIASGTLLGFEVIVDADWEMMKLAAVAAVFAFFAALLALSLMMKLLNSISFTPYVIYRILLGLILLYIAYFTG